MSRGIGAHAELIFEDEQKVIYSYGGYNLNKIEYRNEKHIYDGSIEIRKVCFAEPKIHEKVKKTASGRKKKIIKRIPVSVDTGELLRNGMIKVVNCSNCWLISDDELQVDVMIFHILYRIFQQYQEEGNIPSIISYNV